MRNSISFIFLPKATCMLVVCCCFSFFKLLKAQTIAPDFNIAKYAFISEEKNRIVNPAPLAIFFEQLFELKTEKNSRINVLHIGDSHIQADLLSNVVRTNFQKEFGNGGRGLIVPLRVGGSNEPSNYKISSNVICTAKRCIFVNDPMPIGIGGFTVRTTDPKVSFSVSTKNYPPLLYPFSRISLFHLKDSTAFDFTVTDTAGNFLGSLKHNSFENFPNVSSLKLPESTNTIRLNAGLSDSIQDNATIFGLSLENDSAGLIYHAIGANGAEAFHYARARYFAEQTKVLNPQLIIISLGTNEAQRRAFDSALTEARLDSMVKALQLTNPNVPVLLTTPPDSYIRKKYYNPSVGMMRNVIIDYAIKNNLPVWDLFAAAGGTKSCSKWRKFGFLRPDGVHFNGAGYQLQGNLLYYALLKAYNQYVSARPR